MSILNAPAPKTLSDLDFPIEERFHPLVCWLLDERYSEESILEIVKYADTWGQVVNCRWVDVHDRCQAQELLPAVPESAWAEIGFDIYEVGDLDDAVPSIPILGRAAENGHWNTQAGPDGSIFPTLVGLGWADSRDDVHAAIDRSTANLPH